MNLRRLLASFAIVHAAVAAGCGSFDPLEENIASTQQPLGDPNDEMPQNQLNPDALSLNTELLKALRSHQLNDAGLAEILSDPDVDIPILFTTGGTASAKALMEYIVSCALDKSMSVNSTHGSWNGQFGLCGAEPSFGDWSTSTPTPACLEAVSACVVSRMNKLGKQVTISLRGQDASQFPLWDKVRVEKELRDGGTPIPSFGTCLGAPNYYPTRNCGWKQDYVGICKRGEVVTLLRTPAATGKAMVRVCKGLYGCDDHQLDITNLLGAPYAGFVKNFGEDATIAFTCPSDVGAAPSGKPGYTYFSIMVAPESPWDALPEDPIVTSSGAAFTYPAQEKDVFTYPEGAFYGDIFPGGVNGNGRYACYSEVWKDGKAHLADRLCASPSAGSGCNLSGEPYPCREKLHSVPTPPVCSGKSPAPEEAYLNCKEAPSVEPPSVYQWHHGVTVFLNDPCDLSSTTAGCERPVCAHTECTSGAALDKSCSQVVTSICTMDPYCCTTAWDSICVNKVQSVANSLKCAIGTCSHPLCTTGFKLAQSCDSPPLSSSCVTSICNVDPYCCNTAWDNICVGEVQSVCKKNCN